MWLRALEVAYQGQPGPADAAGGGLAADDPAGRRRALGGPGPPADLAAPENRNLIMARLNPRRVVVYGDLGRSGAARTLLARALPVHPGGGGEPLPGRLRE